MFHRSLGSIPRFSRTTPAVSTVWKAWTSGVRSCASTAPSTSYPQFLTPVTLTQDLLESASTYAQLESVNLDFFSHPEWASFNQFMAEAATSMLELLLDPTASPADVKELSDAVHPDMWEDISQWRSKYIKSKSTLPTPRVLNAVPARMEVVSWDVPMDDPAVNKAGELEPKFWPELGVLHMRVTPTPLMSAVITGVSHLSLAAPLWFALGNADAFTVRATVALHVAAQRPGSEAAESSSVPQPDPAAEDSSDEEHVLADDEDDVPKLKPGEQLETHVWVMEVKLQRVTPGELSEVWNVPVPEDKPEQGKSTEDDAAKETADGKAESADEQGAPASADKTGAAGVKHPQGTGIGMAAFGLAETMAHTYQVLPDGARLLVMGNAAFRMSHGWRLVDAGRDEATYSMVEQAPDDVRTCSDPLTAALRKLRG